MPSSKDGFVFSVEKPSQLQADLMIEKHEAIIQPELSNLLLPSIGNFESKIEELRSQIELDLKHSSEDYNKLQSCHNIQMV
jgi:hypothetical protein